MSKLVQHSNFIFYNADNGVIKVHVSLDSETVWLTLDQLANLFQRDKSVISRHIKNIFKEEELSSASVVANFATTARDGKTYQVNYYNLDMIISVGYRVNSVEATKFRQWATKTLKQYLIKGFVLNDERLKNGNTMFGKDYFAELLEKIREIRASERRFYQKITDLYTTAIDYDPRSKTTQHFYKVVQNKLHWAIHGHTASELIVKRATAKKKNMGLTSWRGANKGGKILKPDVLIAKNYLSAEELSELNRVVSMYLDYAENMTRRCKALTMKDWVKKLDAFLQFNEYDSLDNAGKVSANTAKKLAEKEYEKFRVVQDEAFESDFDKVVKEIAATGKLPTSW